MNRREALSTAGVLVSATASGCVGLDAVLGGSEVERAKSVNAIGDVGDAHPFSLDVELQSRPMGAQAVPKLTITLRNTTGDSQFLSYADSWPEDGLLPHRNSEPRGLRLLAESMLSELTVKTGRCPATAYRPTTDGESIGHRVAAETAYL